MTPEVQDGLIVGTPAVLSLVIYLWKRDQANNDRRFNELREQIKDARTDAKSARDEIKSETKAAIDEVRLNVAAFHSKNGEQDTAIEVQRTQIQQLQPLVTDLARAVGSVEKDNSNLRERLNGMGGWWREQWAILHGRTPGEGK